MNFSSRTIRGALLALTVAFAVSSIPAAGGTAEADNAQSKKAILAILR